MKSPKFSVIMPCLLSDYPGSATRKDQKLIRAIKSVFFQTFKDWELIIVSDGCDMTDYLVKKYFPQKRVKLLRVERNGLFENSPRNAGIDIAKGEYIIYLDADDHYGAEHLKIISDQLSGEDWVWSNDLVYYGNEWNVRECDMEQYAHCGTSNICHARRLNLKWGKPGYGHDYHFIQQLLEYPNFKQIHTAQYQVCHIANSYDV
jgi:glycosyltransferase involved in cell wall biosynthesis